MCDAGFTSAVWQAVVRVVETGAESEKASISNVRATDGPAVRIAATVDESVTHLVDRLTFARELRAQFARKREVGDVYVVCFALMAIDVPSPVAAAAVQSCSTGAFV